MSEYAIEIIKNNGVDVDELLNLLITNAASEMSTYYHYMLLRLYTTGVEGEGLKEIIEDARIEDRNHYEALVKRIYELGGKLPDNLSEFYEYASCPPANLPKNKTNTLDIIKTLRNAERCAMEGYNKICLMTFNRDFRTYDLALAILNEETEHETWFAEILNGVPSGHYKRRGHSSPYVSKFLN